MSWKFQVELVDKDRLTKPVWSSGIAGLQGIEIGCGVEKKFGEMEKCDIRWLDGFADL